ncbi:hypothetical protein LUZ63_020781 [Rhynchospora breviuscula]|uniref:Uncharacterized protein n=1 Tax=Rhynchospora breviuscula TaxID=2022672 RepID=A0A9P9Z8T6_9POAL|nr:hypothetical protein LUZ63_020781 [Rhynchospora breviuscula]
MGAGLKKDLRVSRVRRLESAALLGFPHLGSLGKRIKLALANSLMYYLPSTLCAKCGERKENPWTDPIVSTP